MLFFHSKHPHNRVTIAGEFMGNTLCLAAARCGGKDNFCRKTGRIVASGRFTKGKTLCNIPVEEANYKFFVEQAAILAEAVHLNPHFKEVV